MREIDYISHNLTLVYRASMSHSNHNWMPSERISWRFDPRGHSRRLREKIVGTVVCAVGHAKWMLRFDVDAAEKCCTATTLTVVDEAVGCPLQKITSKIEAQFPTENTEDADEEDKMPNDD